MNKILFFLSIFIFSLSASAQICFKLDSVYTTSGVVSLPVLEDFNNDGKLDIAARDYDSSCVWVRLGVGAGKFGSAVKYTTGVNSRPTGIAVADFNEDGNLDLITSCDNDRVSMLLGNGNGGFGAPTQFTGAWIPRSITVADFNNDGNTDVAVAYWIKRSNNNNIGRWLGDGNGGLTSFAEFSISGYSYMHSITAADFNRDGKIDIATAIGTGLNQFFVMLGNGSGGFGTATAYPTGQYSSCIAVGDFNGDTIPDLAIGTETFSVYNISVHIGDGLGGFSAKTDFPVDYRSKRIATADFDNDSFLDLVVDQGFNVYVLPGKGNGAFGNYLKFQTGGSRVGVATGDVNNDGKPDFVMGASHNHWSNLVFLNCTSINAPIASFSASNTNICRDGCINFSDSSSNNPTSWNWSFPGGTPSSSTAQNPTNICYNTAGTYNVSLTATNSGGGDTSTINGYITVTDTPTTPTVNVDPSNSICQGEAVTLTVVNPCSGCSYTWSPGNQTGTSIQVTSANNYSTEANNSCGYATSDSVSVTVNPLPPTPTISTHGNELISSATVGNQWYFNDSIIVGATQPTYVAIQAGDYYVVVTDTNNCSSQSPTLSFVPIGIVKMDERLISIYPNPTMGRLNFSFKDNYGKATIKIYDMVGKLVFSLQYHGNDQIQTVDLSGLTEGIYNVRVETVEGQLHRKVLLLQK